MHQRIGFSWFVAWMGQCTPDKGTNTGMKSTITSVLFVRNVMVLLIGFGSVLIFKGSETLSLKCIAISLLHFRNVLDAMGGQLDRLLISSCCKCLIPLKMFPLPPIGCSIVRVQSLICLPMVHVCVRITLI